MDNRSRERDAELNAMVVTLKQRYGQRLERQDDDRLARYIDDCRAAAAAAGIEDPNDVLRFIALRFELSPQQQASPLISAAAVRVLGIHQWSSRKRLDFIYKHLINRPPPKDERAFATLLAPYIPTEN